MWRYQLRWILITVGILLTGILAWYESEHQSHTGNYSPWIAISALGGIGLIDFITKIQETSHAKGRLSGQDFLEKYTDLLTNAIEALQDIHEYNKAQLLQTQSKILKLISSVVLLFHPETTNLGINANLMWNEGIDLHSSQNKFADHVYFSDPQRDANSYKSVLCIKAWASKSQVTPPNFAVPVDKDQARVLFGAPRTFETGEEIVIPNIHNKNEINKELSGQPNVVREAIHTFFASQKYKSFMSIAVKNSDKIIAVLNIQSDQLHVFGNQTRQVEIKKFIDPFCTILGIIVSQSQKSAST